MRIQIAHAGTLQNEKAICGIGRDMVTTGRLHAEGCADGAGGAGALPHDRRRPAGRRSARRWRRRRRAMPSTARNSSAAPKPPGARRSACWRARTKRASPPKAWWRAFPMPTGWSPIWAAAASTWCRSRAARPATPTPCRSGPLRLMDQAKGDPDKARDIVDKGLQDAARRRSRSRALYAVGGIWRSFARVDMEEQQLSAPCPAALHHPARPGAPAVRSAGGAVAQIACARCKVVSKRRAEFLPYGAMVLERLLLAGDIKDVVISAYGLREGLFYARLPPEERAKDPLMEFARGANERLSARAGPCARDVRLDRAVVRRMRAPELRRIREASACSPTSAGGAIPTTAPSAPSTRC